jgi:hypothetical protein
MPTTESLNRTIGRNPNLFRKTYGFIRRKPDVYTFVDVGSGATRSFDFQKIVRDRDFFVVDNGGGLFVSVTSSTPPTGSTPTGSIYGEYDEGIVAFNFTDTETQLFNFTFSSTPYVVFSIAEPADEPDIEGWENIIAYGLSVSTTGFDIGTSAPYAGNIRYRAVYSDTYPVVVTSSFTGSAFMVSANAVTVSGTEFDISYSELTSSFSRVLFTTFDTLGNGDIDVYLSSSYADADNVILTSSAEINSPIHVLAFE